MNIATRFSVVIFLMFIIFTGCSDDFDLNADYERQPVVYGVLDPDRSDQIIMINKTFLGNGNSFLYAQVEDSSTYNNVEARVFWDEGESSVALTITVIDDKDTSGVFYSPNQTVYTAPTSEFNFGANPDDEYRIGIMADGDTIYAGTKLVNFTDFDVQLPNSFTTSTLVNSSSDPFVNPLYSNLPIKFRTIENALKHKVTIRLTYNEVYMDGTSQEKSVEYDIQNFDAGDEDGGDDQSFQYEGESFYQTIGNRLTPNGNVDYRAYLKFEVVFYSFGSDLSKYIDIANPTGGIGQEVGSYSNINDGAGHGVFSSRSSYVREVNISNKSIQELLQGQYTNDLGFCYDGIVNCN